MQSVARTHLNKFQPKPSTRCLRQPLYGPFMTLEHSSQPVEIGCILVFAEEKDSGVPGVKSEPKQTQQDLNPGLIGGRRVLSPLGHPCCLLHMLAVDLNGSSFQSCILAYLHTCVLITASKIRYFLKVNSDFYDLLTHSLPLRILTSFWEPRKKINITQPPQPPNHLSYTLHGRKKCNEYSMNTNRKCLPLKRTRKKWKAKRRSKDW